MLIAVPFMLWTEPKRRTWVTLFLSGQAALFIPATAIGGFMLVDLMAGYAIIRHPAGWVQKCIGALFLLMVAFHIGYLFGMAEGNPMNPHYYGEVVRGIGWGQAVLLFGWGLTDAVGLLVDRYRRVRGYGSHSEAY